MRTGVMEGLRRFKAVAWVALVAAPVLLQWYALTRSQELADLTQHYLVGGLTVALCAYCIRLLYRSTWPRVPIAALTVSLVLWTGGVLLSIFQVLVLHRPVDTIASIMLFVISDLPLLYIAVSYGDPHTSRSQQVADGVLLVLLALLYWLNIKDSLDLYGATSLHGQRFIAWALDLESVFLTVAHVFRMVTAGAPDMRRYFRTTSLFLASYTVCIGLSNHLEYTGGVPLPVWAAVQCLALLPFVWLLSMLHRDRDRTAGLGPVSTVAERVALGVSPVLFLVAIRILLFNLQGRHTPLAMTAAGMAVVAYLVRTVLNQYGYARAQDRLLSLTDALERLSYTDAVTEIPNRRAFDQTFEREWAATQRERQDISVLMIDVDFFKAYNDRYGHHAGDQCLRVVARMVAGSLRRPSDFCGRYGGEEFIILLPGTPMKGAEVVALRIAAILQEADLPHTDGIEGRLTVSIGVAARVAGDLLPRTLLERADRNLYRAKALGRNRSDIGEAA